MTPLLSLELLTLACAAAVLAGGAALQSAVGFGMGMFSVPLLFWLGLPLPEAVALFLGGSVAQAGFASRRARVKQLWRPQLQFAAGQWMGVPVGVAGVAWWTQATTWPASRLVGGVLLAVVLLRVSVHPRPRATLAHGWTACASLVSGILAGGLGMGGPPAVLWAMAHDWSASQFRTFLWTQTLLMAPVVLACWMWEHGASLVTRFALGLATAPMLWVVSLVTMRMTAVWGRDRLHGWATMLLLLIAARSLLLG